jgi:hypothetical protein
MLIGPTPLFTNFLNLLEKKQKSASDSKTKKKMPGHFLQPCNLSDKNDDDLHFLSLPFLFFRCTSEEFNDSCGDGKFVSFFVFVFVWREA